MLLLPVKNTVPPAVTGIEHATPVEECDAALEAPFVLLVAIITGSLTHMPGWHT